MNVIERAIATVQDANPFVPRLDVSRGHTSGILDEQTVVLAIPGVQLRDLNIEAPPLIITAHRLVEIRYIKTGGATDGHHVGNSNPSARKPRPTVLVALLLPAI